MRRIERSATFVCESLHVRAIQGTRTRRYTPRYRRQPDSRNGRAEALITHT